MDNKSSEQTTERDYELAWAALCGMTPIVLRHYSDPGYAQEVLDALHSRALVIATMLAAARRDG